MAAASSSVLMTQVTGIAQDSPAQAAGIQPGDIVLDVDDTVVTYDNPLDQEIQQRLGQPVTLTLLRNDGWVDVTLTPRAAPPPGQGALGVQIAAGDRNGHDGNSARLVGRCAQHG